MPDLCECESRECRTGEFGFDRCKRVRLFIKALAHPDVAQAIRLPHAGEGWRHYKGGLYEILGLAHNTETGDLMVAYVPYETKDFPGQRTLMWVRSASVFLGMTKDHKRRFVFEKAG